MSDKLHFDDLTQITCPFGMLDDDTQKRLKDCGKVEVYDVNGNWRFDPKPSFILLGTYRAKPKQKRLLEWVHWHNKWGASVEESLNDALQQHGGCIYRIERDEDGSNPTIELVEVGGRND